ncbi:MAG: glycosyltransferase family protein [Gemmatimonadota bacterium]
MRTIITIEARMRSTRLPGKVLKPLLGEPMLARMIERLRRSRRSDGIVVATTDHMADDPIAAVAAGLGVPCFRGSEDDVLGRVLGAARSVGAELIVETTGDCPLIDPGVIDQLIATFHANQVDYCANVLAPTYPRGLDAQVFPFRVLEEVAALTKDPADREHVSLYIYEHPARYRLLTLASGLPDEVGAWRLTVDTPEDFGLVETIYAELYPGNPAFELRDIVELFGRRPELAHINQHVRQKAAR